MQFSVRMELYGKCMTSIFGHPGNVATKPTKILQTKQNSDNCILKEEINTKK